MTGATLYMLSGATIVAVCLHALIAHANLLRRILALNVMGSGVFLTLTGLARRGPEPDPVPHAMVLTGIVVAVSATAFALALLRRLQEVSGEGVLPEDSAGRASADGPGDREP